jgi:hypothetical protein
MKHKMRSNFKSVSVSNILVNNNKNKRHGPKPANPEKPKDIVLEMRIVLEKKEGSNSGFIST